MDAAESGPLHRPRRLHMFDQFVLHRGGRAFECFAQCDAASGDRFGSCVDGAPASSADLAWWRLRSGAYADRRTMPNRSGALRC